jgi:hypothetical protein
MALQLGVQAVEAARQLGRRIAGRDREQACGHCLRCFASVAMAAHPIQHREPRMPLAPARQLAALRLLVLEPDGLAAAVDQQQVVLVFFAQARPGAQPRSRGHVERAEAQGGSDRTFGNLHSPTLTANSKTPSDD